MRNLFKLSTGLTLIASACSGGPGALQDPPVLQVTSPARSLIQSTAGQLTVMGTVTPNSDGTPVNSVTVNSVAATLNADGTFSANIQIATGAQLIQTVATDAKGDVATDTRSVETGQQQAVGMTIPSAVSADLSPQAFAKISSVASALIPQQNLTAMLAPLQPMINVGGSCLGGKGYIDGLTMTGSKISLVPVAGGLQFSAELDGLDVTGHVNYDVACIDGSDTFEVTASSVTVTGTLDVAPSGGSGSGSSAFTTSLSGQAVNIQNLNVSASGIPGDILNLIDFNGLITDAVTDAAPQFMGPVVSDALGDLAGPHQLSLLGKTIDVQVSPSAVAFTPTSGLISLDMTMQVQGTTGMFTYVADGSPSLNPGSGMQLGIADNLANTLLAQVTQLGMLDLAMPTNGGTFDTATMTATSPPMISASATDGKMQLVLPDMKVVFTMQGTPVGAAALNATLALDIAPSNGGSTVAIQLGTPVIAVNTTDDVPNETHMTNDDLADAVKLGLSAQITSISTLLTAIPLPQMDGISMTNLSVDADQGYVMISGDIQ
jgi:hypothetical protein